jgi:hypothetical protein
MPTTYQVPPGGTGRSSLPRVTPVVRELPSLRNWRAALPRALRGSRGEAAAVAIAYVATAAYLVTRATQVHSWIWMVDEMLYTKGALGFAGGHLTGNVFGVAHSVHAPLYSWLLAPIYGLLNSQQAFKAAHGVDALLFAGVLVPVYLTARYLGARPLIALLAGLLSVWVPWATATLVLMTESLTYFVFAWAVWAMVRALSEPTPGREALALVLIAATAYTRPQFALLFVIFALAAVLCELAEDDRGGLGGRLKRHWLLAAVAPAGILLVAIAGSSLLGGYSQTSGLPRFPPGLWQNMLSHAAHIVVGVGIVPAVVWLGWSASATAARADRRHYAFAILSALIVAFVFYEVGFYSQNVVGGRIQERTAFYPALLFALGIAGLSADLRPRTPRLGMVAAAGVIALVIGAAAFDPGEAAAPFEAIANAGASYNLELQHDVTNVAKAIVGHGLPTAEGLALVTLLIGVVVTVVAAPRFRRIGLPVVAGLALVFCAIETKTVVGTNRDGINAAIPGTLGTPNPPRGWVDAALGRTGEDAGALEAPLSRVDSSTAWLWNEFWNKTIDRVYVAAGTASYSGLPSLPLGLDERTGALHAPVEKQYLLVAASDPRFGLRASVVKAGAFGLNLVKPERPYSVSWAALGAQPNADLGGAAAAPGKTLALAVYRPPAHPTGPVSFTVSFTLARGATPKVPAVVTARGGGRLLRTTLTATQASRDVTVHTTIPAGAARALITVAAGRANGAGPAPVVAVRGVQVT